jgi:Alkylmercury lyase
VIDDWCPLVNLFEDDQAATAWAREHGIAGAARPVAQATQLGTAAWRAYLWPGTTPAGCCAAGGSMAVSAEEGTHGDQD